MPLPRSIELLSPARTADIGREAILHGADAVYIGAPAFGARAAAANSVEDIAELAKFAHIYGAKVYVTLNTILYDNELDAAQNLAFRLYDAGADALIVQDMAFLEMELPPIELHASTQMDITTAEKAIFLERAGFSQIVLARELGIDTIRQIRQQTTVPLEAFVHGALCVSYSGRCYASQVCMSRSANRGECAQFCRLAFDLVDGKGKVIERSKHLLSLRDMNRSASIEEMLDSGISSLKIEGRLKDMAYVKNITAYYRKIIDDIIQRRPEEYQRSSHGRSHITFEPRPEKSFNRGFTEYFLHVRSHIHQFLTPKSLGEKIGCVSGKDSRSFQVDTNAELAAGDGLCFFDKENHLQGIRANRVVNNRVFPLKMPDIPICTEIWRNHDHTFSSRLLSPTAQRHIDASMLLRQEADGYSITLRDETGAASILHFPYKTQIAQKSQRENISRILSKTRATALKITSVKIEASNEPFIPSSVLTDWRRKIVEKHLSQKTLKDTRVLPRLGEQKGTLWAISESTLLGGLRGAGGSQAASHELNVSNRLSRKFYSRLGIDIKQPAVEIDTPALPFAIMTCKHCLLYALGHCRKTSRHEMSAPLSLRLPDGRSFPLHFDCSRCEMQVIVNH